MIKKLAMSTLIGTLSLVYANVNAVVSIVPEETFVKAIGGDKVNVALMVQPGFEPHEYEPKPSQMKEIANADVYFPIGVEFEKTWLPKFANQNKKMKIVNIIKGIQKIPMVADPHEGPFDPHVWTSPLNVKIMAKNIYHYLAKFDSKNKAYYKSNYEKFLNSVNKTDIAINKILLDTPAGTKFMVLHPAFGYFARDYGLTQFAIEAGGKSPKPKQMIDLIDEAKKEKIKAVFVEPEFSQKAAEQIAKEIGVPVVAVSPLNPKWSENLIQLANAIANKK